jgi:hypothetical protein
MKTLIKKSVILYSLVLLTGFFAFAFKVSGQSAGSISGSVTNGGMMVVNSKVAALKKGAEISSTVTDMAGDYKISMLPPGTYDLAFYLKDTTLIVEKFVLSAGESQKFDLTYNETVIDGGEIVYRKPVPFTVDPVQPVTFDRETFEETGGRTAGDVLALSGKVVVKDQGDPMSFGGGRFTSNVTFIDGQKMVGEVSLPVDAIEQVSFLSGGVPAEYGDATGGYVVITTRNPGMDPWVGPARVKKEKVKKGKKTGIQCPAGELDPLG